LSAEHGDILKAILLHAKALMIRLRLKVPEALLDLSRLSDHRKALGQERFLLVLTNATEADEAAAVAALLDQFDAMPDEN
jgi:hypothetical protein